MITLLLLISFGFLFVVFIVEKLIIYFTNYNKVFFLKGKMKKIDFILFSIFDYIDHKEKEYILELYVKRFINNKYKTLLKNIKKYDFTNKFLLRDEYGIYFFEKDLDFYIRTLGEQKDFDFQDFIYNINIDKKEKKENLQKHIYNVFKNENFNSIKLIFNFYLK